MSQTEDDDTLRARGRILLPFSFPSLSFSSTRFHRIRFISLSNSKFRPSLVPRFLIVSPPIHRYQSAMYLKQCAGFNSGSDLKRLPAHAAGACIIAIAPRNQSMLIMMVVILKFKRVIVFCES